MPSYFCPKKKKEGKKPIKNVVKGLNTIRGLEWRETTKEDAYIYSLKFHKLLLFTAEVNYFLKNDYSTTPGLPNLKKLLP